MCGSLGGRGRVGDGAGWGSGGGLVGRRGMSLLIGWLEYNFATVILAAFWIRYQVAEERRSGEWKGREMDLASAAYRTLSLSLYPATCSYTRSFFFFVQFPTLFVLFSSMSEYIMIDGSVDRLIDLGRFWIPIISRLYTYFNSSRN